MEIRLKVVKIFHLMQKCQPGIGSRKKNLLLTGVSVLNFMAIHHHTRMRYFRVDLLDGPIKNNGEVRFKKSFNINKTFIKFVDALNSAMWIRSETDSVRQSLCPK